MREAYAKGRHQLGGSMRDYFAVTAGILAILATAPGGTLQTARRTLWSTRYGPVTDAYQGLPLPWTTRSAFALADANAANFRFLNSFLATDQARSVAAELKILRTYQGIPVFNTLAADSTGHAAYADIQAIPHVTGAEAARCDTALGKFQF